MECWTSDRGSHEFGNETLPRLGFTSPLMGEVGLHRQMQSGRRGVTVHRYFHRDESKTIAKPGGGMKPVTVPLPAMADIDGLLVAMRPKLHRYCARMVG